MISQNKPSLSKVCIKHFLLLIAVNSMPPVLQTDGIDVVDVIPLFLFVAQKKKVDKKKSEGALTV